MRVLLVGGATGYTAALLALLGAEVHAVEENADLMVTAQTATAGADIHWVQGPLAAGAPDAAPFDRIIVDGAIETLTAALARQLADGGRPVAIGRAHVCTPVTTAHLLCRLPLEHTNCIT